MKKALWVVLAVGIALAGAWGYGELVRRENDTGQPLRLLAIAEEQSLALSFSRRGRLTTRVPEEGEAIVERPGGRAHRGAGLWPRTPPTSSGRSRRSRRATHTRLQEIEKLQAQFAAVASEERRIARLVKEGVSPAASLETLQHQREALAAEHPRATRRRRGSSTRRSETLRVRLEKIRHFEKEGALNSPAGGTVLTRHRRHGRVGRAGTADRHAADRGAVPARRGPGGAAVLLRRRQDRHGVAAGPARRSLPGEDRLDQAALGVRDAQELGPPEPRPADVLGAPPAPERGAVVSGQTFVVEAGSGPPKA